MNEEDIQNIQRILVEHFTRQLNNDQEKIELALTEIATAIQKEGDKLIYLDITKELVFLVSVRGKNVVEFHAMVGGNPSEKEKLTMIEEELPYLLQKLKSLEVYVAYIASPVKLFGPFKKLLDKFGFKVSKEFKDDKTPVVAYYKVLFDGT
jgi:hypothetical protein